MRTAFIESRDHFDSRATGVTQRTWLEATWRDGWHVELITAAGDEPFLPENQESESLALVYATSEGDVSLRDTVMQALTTEYLTRRVSGDDVSPFD